MFELDEKTKEILQKQLVLLSERSNRENILNEELVLISKAMAEISELFFAR